MPPETSNVGINLTVSGGPAASRIVSGLVAALRGLQGVEGAGTEQARQRVEAAKAELNAARQLTTQRREEVRAAQSAAAQANRNAKDAVANARAEVTAAREKDRAIAESNQAAARTIAQQRQADLSAAIKNQQQIRASAGASVRAAVENVATEVRARRDAMQRSVQFGRQQVTEARKAAAEENQIAKDALNQAKARLNELQQKLSQVSGRSKGGVQAAINRQVTAVADATANVQTVRTTGQANVQAAIVQAREHAEAVRKASQARTDAAKAALAAARTEAQAAKNSAAANVAQARAVLTAAQQEVAAHGRVGTAAVTAARQQLNAALQTQRAVQQAGQAQIQAAQAALTSARQQQQASSQIVTAARQRLNAISSAAKSAVSSFRSQNQAMQSSANVMQQLSAQVRRLIAAYAGFRILSGFISTGLRFDQVIESANLGIATLITAEAQLTDQNGKVLKGMNALNAATGLANEQVNKLRIAGLQTAATTEQLVDALQQATSSGLAAGLTLDQVRKFTVQIAQAAGAISLPFDQLNQEVRTILDATIDRNSRLAKILDIRNEDVRLAKEQGRLAEFLNEKFQAFTVAGEKALETFATLKSNIKDAVSLLAGQATFPLFENLRKTGLKALEGIFDFKTAEINTQFQGLLTGLRAIFAEMGDIASGMISFFFRALQDISAWLDANRTAVQQVVAATGTLVRQFGGLLADVLKIVAGTIKWAVESGVLLKSIRFIDAVILGIRDNLPVILAAFAALTASLAINPFTVVALGVAGIIGLLHQATAEQKAFNDEQLRGIRATGDMTAEAVKLTAQYSAIARELKSGKLSNQEAVEAREELKSIIDKLIRISPEYKELLHQEGKELEDNAQKVRDLTDARIDDLNIQLHIAQVRKQQQLAILKEAAGVAFRGDQTNLDEVVRQFGESDESLKARRDTVIAALSELKAANATINAVLDAGITVLEGVTEARLFLNKATVGGDPNRPNRGVGANKALNDELQKATGLYNAAKAASKSYIKQLTADFEAGKVTSQEFFEKQRDSLLSVVDAEEKVRKAREKLARAKGDRGEIDQAVAEEAIIAERREEIIADFNDKVIKSEKELQKRRAEIAADVLALDSGDDSQIMAKVKDLVNKYAEDLAIAFREKDFGTVANIGKIIEQGTAQIRFDNLQNRLGRVTDTLDQRLNGIQARIEAGTLSQVRAQDEIGAAYREASKGVQELIQQMLLLEPTLKTNPEFIKSLEEMEQKVLQFDTAVREATDFMFQFGNASKEAIQGGLEDFFSNLGQDAKSAAALFREAIVSMIRDIQRFVAHMTAARIASFLFSSVFGGATSGGGSPVTGVDNVPSGGGTFAATGGRLFGPGTETSDSITVFASKDEFIHRAKAARMYGYDFMHAINQMKLDREAVRDLMRGAQRRSVLSRNVQRNFALGGAVGAVQARSQGVLKSDQLGPGRSGVLNVRADRGLILEAVRDIMLSRDGEKIYMQLDQRTIRQRNVRENSRHR